MNDAIVTTDWKGAFALAWNLCLFLSGKCFLMLNNVVTFLASTVFLTMKHCHALENGPRLPLSPLTAGLGGFRAGPDPGQGVASCPVLSSKCPFPNNPIPMCLSTSYGWDGPSAGHRLPCISWCSEPTHAQLRNVFPLKCVSFGCSDYPVCASFLFGQIFDTYTSNEEGWMWL